jgi:hypothetical protein
MPKRRHSAYCGAQRLDQVLHGLIKVLATCFLSLCGLKLSLYVRECSVVISQPAVWALRLSGNGPNVRPLLNDS